jgi:hypothetical protein
VNDIKVNGKRFTLTKLNSYGFSVGIRQWRKSLDEDHFILSSVKSVFDKSKYDVAHKPIVVDGISFAEKFSHANDIRVLECPIKFAGRNEYRIPRELIQFEEAIAKSVAFEHAINPSVIDYYAYITIDQGYVKENVCQRSIGCRVNGFQGAKVNPKLPVARSYVAYDRVPMKFYNQGFQTDHLDDAKHNFFFSFDEQRKKEAEHSFERYNILLTNAYTVYRNTTVDYPVYRTFFRLTYDVRRYERFGNTHNPLYDYRWNMKLSNAESHLTHKRIADAIH